MIIDSLMAILKKNQNNRKALLPTMHAWREFLKDSPWE